MLLWGIYVIDNNKMYLGLHVKCPTFLSSFNEIWNFWTDILKNGQTDRQTDITK